MVRGYKLLTAIQIDNNIEKLEGEIRGLAGEKGFVTLEVHNLLQELESYENAVNAVPETYGIDPKYGFERRN